MMNTESDMLATRYNVAGSRPTIFTKVLLALSLVLDMLCMDAMQLLCVAKCVQSWNLVMSTIGLIIVLHKQYLCAVQKLSSWAHQIIIIKS
jgi:hypothetical protein